MKPHHCVGFLSPAVLLLILAHVPAEDAPAARLDETILREGGVGLNNADLLGYFRKRTFGEADRKGIAALITQLGDESFEVREKATADLRAMGGLPLAQLQQATRHIDPEIVRRAEELLQQTEARLACAAARLLALRKPVGGATVLVGYLPAAPDEVTRDLVVDVLHQVAVVEGKLDPIFVTSLTDPEPIRRAIAAVILVKESPKHREAVRKLMRDPTLTVRSAVIQALVRAGDKQGVEPLIGLLKELPLNQAWEVEDLLFRLAGEQAVKVTLGSEVSDAQRLAIHQAWLQWWETQGDGLDLAKILEEHQERGLRVVCQLQGGKQGSGRICALNADDTIHWQFDNVEGPIDVQMQPNGRVLVAEINANRVTERDRTGHVVWEKKTLDSPMTAQRLRNGNIFIATYTTLLEVTPEGKALYTYEKPGQRIYCAQKLRNGNILYVSSAGLVIELTSEGKEVRSIPCGDTSNWGSVEALPNGHFLVCRCSKHEVVEIDAAGKVLWRVDAQWPTWACQRRNGTILVACANSGQVIEFDRGGKERWKQKLEGRPTRVRNY